jgi:hypothetical protein
MTDTTYTISVVDKDGCTTNDSVTVFTWWSLEIRSTLVPLQKGMYVWWDYVDPAFASQSIVITSIEAVACVGEQSPWLFWNGWKTDLDGTVSSFPVNAFGATNPGNYPLVGTWQFSPAGTGPIADLRGNACFDLTLRCGRK